MDETISSGSTRPPLQGGTLQSSDSVEFADINDWMNAFHAQSNHSIQDLQISSQMPR